MPWTKEGRTRSATTRQEEAEARRAERLAALSRLEEIGVLKYLSHRDRGDWLTEQGLPTNGKAAERLFQ